MIMAEVLNILAIVYIPALNKTKEAIRKLNVLVWIFLKNREYTNVIEMPSNPPAI